MPELHSSRAQEPSDSNHIVSKKRHIFSPKPQLQAMALNMGNSNNSESDDSALSNRNLSSRILDKEECEVNYKLINERMRNKVRKIKMNKYMLFTFNPSKLRLKSPVARQQKCLI